MNKTSETKLSEFVTLGELKLSYAEPKQHYIECYSDIKERPCPHCGEFSSSGYDKRICRIKDSPLC